MRKGAFCLLLFLLSGCSSNTCQQLCDAYYQMQLRCDLFAGEDAYHPARCAEGANDPLKLREQADYNIRRCRQDFQLPSCEEEKSCCKSLCFKDLLQDFDAVVGTNEADYETQRDLCRKYRELVKDGEAPWCNALQTDCLESLDGNSECTSGG